MATVYKWKFGSRVKRVKAQDAGEVIERIKRRKDGGINPDDVVTEARQKTSPLHPAFEWNLRSAAAAHWRNQARYIIRSLEVVRINEIQCPPKTRGFVSLASDDDTEDRSYRTIRSVMESPVYRDQILQQALEEIKLWKERYASFKELVKIFEAIERTKVA